VDNHDFLLSRCRILSVDHHPDTTVNVAFFPPGQDNSSDAAYAISVWSVPHNLSLEDLRNLMYEWDVDTGVGWQLKNGVVPAHLSQGQCNNIVRRMMDCGAVDRQDGEDPTPTKWFVLTHASPDMFAERDVLRDLEEVGLVRCVHELGECSHWVLTFHGLVHVVAATQRIMNPRPVFARRDVDQDQWSRYELIDYLFENGWSLCLSKRSARRAIRPPPYSLDQPKQYFLKRGQQTLSKAYLLALAYGENICKDGVAIEHFQADKYYVRLLGGETVLSIEDDNEGQVLPPLPPVPGSPGTECDGDLMNILFSPATPEALATPTPTPVDEIFFSPTTPPAEPDVDCLFEPPTLVAPASAVNDMEAAPDALAPPSPEAVAIAARKHVNSSQWGMCFHLTQRLNRGSPSLQMTCLVHSEWKDRRRCTKGLSFTAWDPDSLDLAVRRLKAWALKAATMTEEQHRGRSSVPPIDGLPAESVLDEQLIQSSA
jgi:hypothetical protein